MAKRISIDETMRIYVNGLERDNSSLREVIAKLVDSFPRKEWCDLPLDVRVAALDGLPNHLKEPQQGKVNEQINKL